MGYKFSNWEVNRFENAKCSWNCALQNSNMKNRSVQIISIIYCNKKRIIGGSLTL